MSKLYAPVWVAPVQKFAIIFVVTVLILTPIGAARAADGEFVWARSMGGDNWDTGFDIALDGAGNVYTTGFFKGTADFDPGPGVFNLISAGTANIYLDIFVSKLDSDGNFVWARSMGGSNDDTGLGISADGAGNVYTIGRFQGTADFDPGPGTFNLTSAGSAGAFDIFVSKLDSVGNFVWARSIGSSDQDKGFDIAVDETGNVYITGLFEGTVDFDPGPGTFNLTSTSGSADIFVSKLNSDGNFVWAQSMGGLNGDIGLRIAVDGAGNVYPNGSFRGTTDFDPGPGTFNLTSAGDADIFVSKLDSAGNFVWAWSKGSSGFDEGLGIVVDGTGNVYTTALLQDAVASSSDADIFVGKLDSAGNLVWGRSMGSPGFDKGYGIALDRPGDIYITGTFHGTVDFDPGPGEFNITSDGDGDIFVSKLDSDGNFVWTRSMGGAKFEEGIGIVVDETGNIYTAGRFQGTADFDPGSGTFNLTSTGFDDIFVSKLTGSTPDDSDSSIIIFLPIIVR
ncbi:SBBP repeat-containing protein [Chloroflexota bacterium]